MSSFDDMAIAYDRSIAWDRRIARELPFILEGLQEDARVLDLACGSGRHAIALAERGHRVVGIDKSKAMIREARQLAQNVRGNVEFVIGNMIDIETLVKGEFDAVICIGNSLALLDDMEHVSEVIHKIFGVLSKHGKFIAQVLNFQAILREGFKYFPIKGVLSPEGEVILFARFFQHIEEEPVSRLIMSTFLRNGGKWTTYLSTQQVLRLNAQVLQEILRKARFTDIETYSDYSRGEFDPDSSRSLVIRAQKR